MNSGLPDRLLGRTGEPVMFLGLYEGKKVLITGNSGFKGTWLTLWLRRLGATPIGFSNGTPERDAFFRQVGQPFLSTDIRRDIRDFGAVLSCLELERPDFIFHLAAQSVVSESYRQPLETISTNALGTATLLEAVRVSGYSDPVVVITSDKCYRNDSRSTGYSEVDTLGGVDPYSASKACAELIFRSYVESGVLGDSVLAATARAGNVIGGGDWTRDRIVPDTMRNWSEGKAISLRMPKATRPWQHVLEPLSGYLWLGSLLASNNAAVQGASYNFGPDTARPHSVAELVASLAIHYPGARIDPTSAEGDFSEAPLLALDCTKALLDLAWEPNLDFDETCALTASWYLEAAKRPDSLLDVSDRQLEFFSEVAMQRGRVWASNLLSKS